MATKTFKKEYIAILDGILEKSFGTISAPISRKSDSIIEREINMSGEKAVTHYALLKTNLELNISIVQFVLETGRTHQIRLHSNYIGHPIIGDTLYGSASNLINRQALHSNKISFIHPITKEAKKYIAPLPFDIQNIMDCSKYTLQD